MSDELAIRVVVVGRLQCFSGTAHRFRSLSIGNLTDDRVVSTHRRRIAPTCRASPTVLQRFEISVVCFSLLRLDRRAERCHEAVNFLLPGGDESLLRIWQG